MNEIKRLGQELLKQKKMGAQPDHLAVPVMHVTAKKGLIDIKNSPPDRKPPLPSQNSFANALAEIRKAKLESPKLINTPLLAAPFRRSKTPCLPTSLKPTLQSSIERARVLQKEGDNEVDEEPASVAKRRDKSQTIGAVNQDRISDLPKKVGH